MRGYRAVETVDEIEAEDWVVASPLFRGFALVYLPEKTPLSTCGKLPIDVV